MNHGTIKLLSKVKSKWLNSLVPKLEKVDTDKLLGILTHKRPFEEKKETLIVNENIDEKIENARQRYLKRKIIS